MRFQLRRTALRPDGAFGVLHAEGAPIATTVERTYPRDAGVWNPAARIPDTFHGLEYPKIPPGKYTCTRTVFLGGKPSPYETFEILVPGHSRILIHKAAVETDVDGCLGLGQGFGAVGGRVAVLGAPYGLAAFLSATLGQTSVELVVYDPTPEVP